MLEWLILVIVVPAVVVPVVLLTGFAGCDRVFGLDGRFVPPPPIITLCDAIGLDSVSLAWTFADNSHSFIVERTQLPGGEPTTFDVDSLSHTDNNLAEGSTYLYRVRAINKLNGELTEWSASASAKTHSFYTAFEWKDYEEVFSRNTPGWAGQCIVQRIEAVRLMKSGGKVRLTLRASSTMDALIKRVYLSRPEGSPSRDPYDPDIDLTSLITTPFTIAANTTFQLPTTDYNLDENAPLLIAVDFADSPASGIRTSDHAENVGTIHVPPDEAQTFFRPGTEGAALQDRTGFDPTPGFNLVYKIEVVAP